MPNLDELAQQLLALPPREYSELIRKVDARWREVAQREEKSLSAKPGMSRDDFAEWLAAQHYIIDKGITRVVYLPTDAPEKEIRLLEVNELASIPEMAPVEAFDFDPGVNGLDFSVHVADVSPRQYDMLNKGEISLPTGWTLNGAREIPRRL